MRRRWPELYAKEVLGSMLVHRGTVITEYEIHNELTRRADMHFAPDPARQGQGELGILERIARHGECLIELFSQPPSPGQALDCMTKHQLWHQQRRDQAHAAPPRPMLWILSPGRPDKLIAGLDMKPMHGWPPGFWRMGEEMKTFLTVVREVPVTHDTLPLRLLNEGKRLAQAIDELKALPKSSWLRQRMLRIVLAWQKKLAKDFHEEPMQYFTTETETEFDRYLARRVSDGTAPGLDKWIEQGREQGLERGIEQGERALLRKQLTMRFGALPGHAEKRLDNASSTELELWAKRVLTADTLDAVLAD